MPVRWAAVMRGINKPLVVDVISNWAEGSGVVIPMATWAWVLTVASNKKNE
ncbi:MAG: hypothetical protein WDO71_15925 [Bacteroidota bacterium]